MYRLRNEFQTPDMHINALHGASTPEQADRELKKFFPIEQTIALIKPGVSKEQKGNFNIYFNLSAHFLHPTALNLDFIVGGK